MNRMVRLLAVLCVFPLAALPLTGCENPPWESGMTLVLKVDAPTDGATVAAPTVTVSGRVNGTERAGAKVRVKDADVPVKDGKFSTDVALTEGKNVIPVVATAGQANLKEQVTVTCVPAKQ